MARGGYRAGAGRPKGNGKYAESTKPIRIPISLIGKVCEYIDNKCFNLHYKPWREYFTLNRISDLVINFQYDAFFDCKYTKDRS